MPDFVIDAAETPIVPVAGGGKFPVRRIFCVGRNYAAHAREMGAAPDREPPFFFSKPPDTVISTAQVPYPPATRLLHFEMELVVAIGRGGTAIASETALDHVYGYAAGVDLTRRDLQDEAKSLRRPWDMSKGFDAAAPIGTIVPAARVGHPAAGSITLAVNGVLRQNGDLADMIWPVPNIIAFLSNLITLKPGDLIFTGTPEGVGTIERGDKIEGSIEGVGTIAFQIA
ncbi:MAG: fumarylacetoacetate hydrolase family protein [Acidiphilium sp.]|nr:fumarylacetoacetate hydrolase family protein [Acidiphilium sp.]MDD4934933.1 fumarylacetoacetate hydrolase family protein [Acidiphilium sp.]